MLTQFPRESDAKNNLLKRFKAEYKNSRRCPSMKFDFETLWSCAQVILERNTVSVKLVRASGKQIQDKLDAETDKDDSERVDSDEDEDLFYSISYNGERFCSAVSSSEDAPECLKLFKTFQEKSFAQAKSVGLFVNAHLHEILSLYNIILLKKEQSYPEIDMNVLYKDTLDEYKNYEKVDKGIFSEITEAYRIDEASYSWDELKIMLFEIYEKAKREDRKIIDVLVNLWYCPNLG